MALTTPANRRSAATTAVVWGPPSVTSDSAKDAPWRASAGWGYEGISVAEPVARSYLCAASISSLEHAGPSIAAVSHAGPSIAAMTHTGPTVPPLGA